MGIKFKSSTNAESLLGLLLLTLLFVVIVLLAALPVMWLWNYAMVAAVTFAKPIEYWVAVCLTLLLSILVKN